MSAVAGTENPCPNGLKIGAERPRSPPPVPVASALAAALKGIGEPHLEAAASRERATGLITWGQDHLGDCRSGVIQTHVRILQHKTGKAVV